MYSCSCRKSKELIPHGLSVEGKPKMEILAETSLSASHRLRGEDSSLTNLMGSPSREGLVYNPNIESQKTSSAE